MAGNDGAHPERPKRPDSRIASERSPLEIFVADRLVTDALVLHLASARLACFFLGHLRTLPLLPLHPVEADGSPSPAWPDQLLPRRLGCKGLISQGTASDLCIARNETPRKSEEQTKNIWKITVTGEEK